MAYDEQTTRVAVVFHSGYGHTAKQAEAVAAGAAPVSRVASQLISIDGTAAPWGELELAHAIVFGCPTYMAGPSTQFKAFEDASSRRGIQVA